MSTEAVAAAVREGGANRTALRIAGRANWLSAGRPVKASRTVSLRDDSGVVSYVPGDLTLTVRAGTTLAEIGRITGEHDQWLPLDPFGSDEGTIGATMATASAGSLAASFGLPRDLLLGLEFVNGRGEIVRAGGKVVKNVAGFDLSRLLTGSWGTLGVITEVTVRLYARPAIDRTFAVPLGRGQKSTTELLRAVAASPLTPFALEILNGAAASSLGFGDNPTLLVRFGGNAPVVDIQLKAFSQLARIEEVERSTWAAFREMEGDATSVIRISTLPTRFLATASSILADTEPRIVISIDPRRGIMRLVTRDGGDQGAVNSADGGISLDFPSDAQGVATSVIFEKLPAEVWPVVSPSVAADPLSRGIKKAYDPHNVLNPGILGD
ncbi:MAG: glycolate oxidase binding subunit [Gemmatimonadaceae bacterium]|nr:glycolate oxidase binding subunit [Gemmatimonadaceae bacterium]